MLIENKISYLKTVDKFWRVVNNDFCIEVATDLGIDFNIFRDGYLYSSSRPELYDAQILDRRMPADAYRITAILGSEFYFENDKVGISEYTIGFKSIRIAEQTVGVLAIPTLFQQEEVFRELAQRNALLAGIYFAVLFLIVGISVLFANRMTQPLRRLQTAAHAIGEGNLNITVTSKANDETGALVKAFNQMVSEIKQRREEQAQYERDLAWKEMAKQVAHEIKNPLTPMKLSVQHLQQAFKDKVKDFDKIVFRVTKTIIEQIDSLARIATEFSHFSRMPVRKFESVELHNLLEETISLFKGVKGIEIQKEFSIINPIVIADKDELRRVFINIVRNSVQAIEKNGLIKMQTSVQNDKCTISISDTGIGIQPEHLPNVLKPNFSTKAGGMGLGLAICRQIITDLNGSINVSSVYGRGTKVEIILPVSQNIA